MKIQVKQETITVKSAVSESISNKKVIFFINNYVWFYF